ncbi:MAG: hypothetical protein ACT4OO_03615 [Nitrospiraceae bacterium]
MEIERTLQQWSVGRIRIRWGAIWAGFAVGLTTQMVLMLLGLAIGAWSIDLRETEPTEGIPLGTGIWTGISMLISAFIGGFVAARSSGAYLRSDGFYHGAVLWGVTWVAFAWLTTTAMSYLVGGLFSTLGSTLQSVGQGVGKAASAAATKADDANVNLSAADLRRQVESVLRAGGKKELQPGAMQKSADKVAGQAREGQSLDQVTDSAIAEIQQKLALLDRGAAMNVMVQKFGMSETQAREVVHSTIGILEPIKQKVAEVKEQSLDVGNTTLKKIGQTAWWLFMLGLLSFALSGVGGTLGVSEESTIEVKGESYRTDVRRAG